MYCSFVLTNMTVTPLQIVKGGSKPTIGGYTIEPGSTHILQGIQDQVVWVKGGSSGEITLDLVPSVTAPFVIADLPEDLYDIDPEDGRRRLRVDIGQEVLQGEQGIQGEPGPQGIQGIQGIQGLKGEKGDTGATGPTGPSGISMRIERYSGTTNASGLVTITYSTPFAAKPHVNPVIHLGGTTQIARIISSTTTGCTILVEQRASLTVLSLSVLSFAATPVVGAVVDILVIEP